MKKATVSLLPLMLAGLLACVPAAPPTAVPPASAAAPAVDDPHSLSNPEETLVRHIDLDLTVDFERKQLRGSSTLTLDPQRTGSRLVLDTSDMTIRGVTDGSGRPLQFTHEDAVEILGRALTIQLPARTRKVTVSYETGPNAQALQWLTPEMTAGKKHPFLFTQSQSILARSWIPLQDSPAVRTTYTATVRVPRELLAVMSAENPQERNATGIYHFRMTQPISSYLYALSVGDLAFRPLSANSGVYAEPSVVEKAAWEFAETPKMIEAAEKLYGPYRWGRYDILVLPPSFPYGGMENPRLTFATPTILAGDRSLVALVAHELAHSWSGNLVTNATWNDFWLNEGFTTYFEHRIMEAVYGREYSEMLSLLSRQELLSTVADRGETNKDTALFVDFTGRDPDDAGATAYEKGYMFLRMIEEAVGRETFDAFLREYFERHAFQSMTTTRFVEYLRANLIRGDQALESRLRIDEWIYGPGVPSNVPTPQSPRFAAVDSQTQAFIGGAAASSLQTAGWTTHEWLHFVRALPATLPADRMAELDRQFKFSETGNSEVLAAWLEQSIRTGYEGVNASLDRFLTSVGRRKFLRPLYQELVKTEKGRQMARDIYSRARASYHPLAQESVDKIVNEAK